MKRMVPVVVGFLSIIIGLAGSRDTRNAATHVGSETSTFGVFSGTSPCNEFLKPFLRIPHEEKCDRITWKLSLYRDAKRNTPATYTLAREFGYHVDNRTYKSIGSMSFEGTWEVRKGRPTDPDAVVFQLEGNKPHGRLEFLQVDQDILHPLDSKQNLLVGTSGYSYTLNREERTSRATAFKIKQAKHALPAESNLTAEAAFSGRSPCRELARELNAVVEPDCARLKWSLTLYRDPKTLAPTTYKLRGTLYRLETREGKWKVIRGTKTDPNAIVYQLDAGGDHAPLLLLKVDDGVLFFLASDKSLLRGNADFSYTLNRDFLTFGSSKARA